MRNTMKPKTKVAQPMIGARRNRSASHPIGTMPSTRKPPEIPATKTITPELTWKDERMLGARTARPELCRLSRDTITASTRKVRKPGLAQPVANEACSSRVPGKRSSGNTTSSTADAARWRSCAVSETSRARSAGVAASPGPEAGGVTTGTSLTSAWTSRSPLPATGRLSAPTRTVGRRHRNQGRSPLPSRNSPPARAAPSPSADRPRRPAWSV